MIHSSNKLWLGVIFTLALVATTVNAFGLPPVQPFETYAQTPTKIPPFFGYDKINTEKAVNQIGVVGYVTGAPIEELYNLVNDFTEDSVFWKKTCDIVGTAYRSGKPNNVGDVRDFIYKGKDARYVEMIQHSDPENHVIVYSLQAAESKFLNAVLTTVSFVEEPENNRIRVEWRALMQTVVPFKVIKATGRQKRAYSILIETLQTFYP